MKTLTITVNDRTAEQLAELGRLWGHHGDPISDHMLGGAGEIEADTLWRLGLLELNSALRRASQGKGPLGCAG